MCDELAHANGMAERNAPVYAADNRVADLRRHRIRVEALRGFLFRLLFGPALSDVLFPAFFPFPLSWQVIAKIADPGQVKHPGSQFQGPAVKAANVAGSLDQVTRLTRPQFPVL